MQADPNATIQTRTFFNPHAATKADCGDDCDDDDTKKEMKHDSDKKHHLHHETEMFTTPPPSVASVSVDKHWTTPITVSEISEAEAEAADVILFGIDSVHKAANDTALASHSIEKRVELIKKAVELIILAAAPTQP
jgi:hypothetical protein